MTSSGEHGYARIEPGGQAYQNSYAKPGETVRVALCGKCMDSGRELTDDDTRGDICDCAYGYAYMINASAAVLDEFVRRELDPKILPPICRAACPSHDRTCQEYEDDHKTHPAGHLLHVCNGGRDGLPHHFYSQEVAS